MTIGAGVGAAVGAVAGLLIAKDKSGSDRRKAVLIGAGVGALTGGGIGAYQDRGQDALNPNFFQVLNSVAIVLNKYPKTLLDIDGHTDSVGDEASNQALSERRAVTVARYLNSRQVDSRRLQVIGFGESRPIADNASDAGRAANRRVEIRISPITQ